MAHTPTGESDSDAPRLNLDSQAEMAWFCIGKSLIPLCFFR
jgi:hypothetical protein